MKKIVKIAVIAVVVILAIALIAPAALRGKIADIVKREANAMLAARLDFEKLDIRVGHIKHCEKVKKANKLLKFTIDDGSGTDRQILSGIAKYYKPEELVGKTLGAIINLPPRKMMGLQSCGMLISAVHKEKGEEKLHLLMVDDAIPAGAKLC